MFKGPWKVIERKSLDSGMPSVGDIIHHTSGAIILHCPKCRAMQFTHSPISGPTDAPTLSKSIQCGSGTCNRCGIWFSVDAGKTVITEAPSKKTTPIPTKLVEAGVKKPPKLPKSLR